AERGVGIIGTAREEADRAGEHLPGAGQLVVLGFPFLALLHAVLRAGRRETSSVGGAPLSEREEADLSDSGKEESEKPSRSRGFPGFRRCRARPPRSPPGVPSCDSKPPS